MVTASLSKLIYCIQIETDPSFVASLYKAVGDTLRVVGLHGALTPELTNGLMDGTKVQLQHMAEKRKRRAGSGGVVGSGSSSTGSGGGSAVPVGGGGTDDPHHAYVAQGQGQGQGHDDDDRDEMALMEEMEEFALEDMEKTLRMLDGQHPLLIAIASVRELGCHAYAWDGEEEHGNVEG